ncbi:MAG: hypothetical protein ACFFAU_09715 [Candidatus Hodarchaeota archaeon]
MKFKIRGIKTAKGMYLMATARNLTQRILGPYRLSHHPLCDNFHDHIYLLLDKKVCRGCVMQYSGIFLSFTIIVLGNLPSFEWWKGLSEFQVGFVLYLLILPTIFTGFFIRNRIAKDIARFLLGVSFTIAFVQLIFTPNWLIKGWILINFIPGYIYLNRRRTSKNGEVCESCNEYSKMPYCSGFQIYSDREKIFLKQAIQGGIKDPFSLSPDQLEE